MSYYLNFCEHCKTLIYYNKGNAGWYHIETEAVWCHWKGPHYHKKTKAEPEAPNKKQKK